MTTAAETPKTRPPLTAEDRRRRLDDELRIELLVLMQRRKEAREESDSVEAELTRVLRQASANGVSMRDLAAVVGMPHQTVHQYVKPYERKPRERAAA